MSDCLPQTKGLRLLCFDGGGLCCLSQALIVKEMLGRLQYDSNSSPPLKVINYFDMIGGSGFGGLLAIMAGILEMNIDELVFEFSALCVFIFSGTPTMRERTERLKASVKGIVGKYLRDRGGEERTMLSGHNLCKVFVCASSSHNMAYPRIFRNYIVRENPTADCAVWQAACATMAMPGLFESVEISTSGFWESILGGETRWRNAAPYLAEEAATIFSGHHVACIVSIGSGHPHILSLSDDLATLFKAISTDCQLQANEMEARYNEVPDLYWRLEVEQGLQDLGSLQDVAAFSRILSSTISHLQRVVTTQKINALLDVLRTQPEYVSTRAITGRVLATACTVRLKRCPNPTLYFTGKEAELKQMTEYFNSMRYGCRVCVLWGLGGAGKTQIGLKFIQLSQKARRFTDIFFLDASDIDTLHSDFKTVAGANSAGSTVEDAMHYLSSRQDDWLLFIDNADDPSLDLRPFVSWSHGNVLITTRNVAVRAHAPDCHLRVHSLTMDESVSLLMRGPDLRMDEKTKSAAAELVKELGFLPLAISHARAYLEHGSCDLDGYLKLYRIDHQSLLQKRPVQSTDSYEYSVYSTWMISFKRLSEHAVVFLQLLCFMHHEGIPSRMVEVACQNFFEREAYYENCVPRSICDFLSYFQRREAEWRADRFHSLLNEILSLSLMQSDVANHTLSFHPLVQKLLRSLFEASHDMIIASQSFQSLALPNGESNDDHACRRGLAVHLRSTAGYGIMVHPILLNPIGRAYLEAGKNVDACRIWEREMELRKQLIGLDHPDTLRSMNNLAISYQNLGRAAEAVLLHEQVLTLRKRILGPEHPDTLTGMNNLAISYMKLGHSTEAVPLNEQVVALRKRILGLDHPHTLASMSNRANLYRHLGRASEAASSYEQVLELITRTLGPEHPDTLASMNNLAISYIALGRSTEAVLLNEQVLTLRKRILGPEHPDTLRSMNNLANSYKTLGCATEAAPLNEQVLTLRKRTLGAEHPTTLVSMNNLAVSYRGLGRSAEALSLEEQVLQLRTQVLGPMHPDTIWSLSSLAVSYMDIGRTADALLLTEQILELRKRALGTERANSLSA